MAEKQLTSYCILFILAVISLTGCSVATPGKTVFDYEREASQAYENGRYEIAVNGYEYLVKQVPKDPNFWFRLGNSYGKNGDLNKSAMAYQNTLLRDVTYEKAWYNLGVIQMQQALKTFIDMQKAIPQNSPVQPLAEKKMNGLFLLLGQNPDEKIQPAAAR